MTIEEMITDYCDQANTNKQTGTHITNIISRLNLKENSVTYEFKIFLDKYNKTSIKRKLIQISKKKIKT